MSRIKRERGVLATLLLEKHAYRDLPAGFTSDDFETSDYQMVFGKLLNRFIEVGEPIDRVLFELENPELKKLLDDILFVQTSLNGTFKSEAISLTHHLSDGANRPNLIHPNGLASSIKHVKSPFQFTILNGMQIMNSDIPEQSFLVRNLISEHSVNFLSGEEGCGKSLLAMNLAICIAVGTKMWLKYEIVKPGKVVYLNNELAFIDFGRRLKVMGSNLPARGDITNLIVPKEVPSLEECWETLNELCEKEKPCLIVIDTLYFSHNRDENDSSDMKALMRRFLELRDRYGLAVLLIHHTKKGASFQRMHNDQMRGSNVFGGVTDTVLQIRRSASDERMRIMKPTKFRHVSDENRKCRLLSLNGETLWFKDEGETDEAEHLATVGVKAKKVIDFKTIFKKNKELSRKEILKRCQPLGFDERTIDRMLKNAKSDGKLEDGKKFGHYRLKAT